MADIGRGITLSDQCDSCGEIKEKKFVLRDMSSQELRKLERECRESGLVEAERVHSYREFVVKKKLGVRSSRRRIRNKVRTALSGINDGLSLSELDEIATKLGMHPSAGVLVG
ncbi:hypothetical protein CMI41_02120 [Candidatus Pacearchaeota archaeon]|nr:hypothetical protein [Candidatus Pacearchaeota archaeon]